MRNISVLSFIEHRVDSQYSAKDNIYNYYLKTILFNINLIARDRPKFLKLSFHGFDLI